MALDVLLSAAEVDPARSAVDAVVAASGGLPDPDSLLNDIRRLLARRG